MNYVSNPNLEVRKSNGEVSFCRIFVPEEILVLDECSLSIYEECKTPVGIEALAQLSNFNHSVFERMLNYSIICREDELSFLSNGFLTPPKDAVSKFVTWDEFIREEKKHHSFAFFGVPTDNAGTKGGARFGSMLIRSGLIRPVRKFNQAKEGNSQVYDFELRKKIDPNGLQIFDVGDVFCPPMESQREMGLKIGKVVRSAIEMGCIPIMLGGDHSLTFHSVNAIADLIPDFGIIHFDAHHDIYVNSIPQQKSLNHGNAFAHLLKRKELNHLRQIGLRTFDFLSEHSKEVRDSRVRYFSSYEAQKLSPEEIFKDLPNIPYYLSFDIDCLSPNVTSDTGTPVIGGLTYYQALSLLDYASSKYNIIGYDFVEVADSSLSNLNFGGDIAARYIITCLSNALHQSAID